MASRKRPVGKDVLTAARERIAWVFDTFSRICVSFSAGKDSTVMLHLAAEAARERGRRFAVLLIDLEAQYRLTMEHAAICYAMYADCICQPYGDDQRKGLWLFHLIEPETWGRIVARVTGANAGSLYAREPGNVLGNGRVSLPPGHTWQSFARLLLTSLPPATKLHFENKIAAFLKWHMDRGYGLGIPDEAPPAQEAKREVPSWRRICKALLRNDYWCKGLSFSQHKSDAYAKYLQVMARRRARWNLVW